MKKRFKKEYPTELGSPPIVKLNINDYKQTHLATLHHHTNQQLNNLKQQAELLTRQAQEIYGRIELAEKIINANFKFKPVLLKPYYLYQKNSIFTLSMIGPDEWSSPYGNYIATVRQLGDGTWERINEI